MLLHTIISQSDIFSNGYAVKNQPKQGRKSKGRAVTDPKQYIKIYRQRKQNKQGFF